MEILLGSEDYLPALSQALLKKHSLKYKKAITSFDKNALQKLLDYSYAYVQEEELEEIIERAVVLCEGDTIHAEHLLLSNSPNMPAGRLNIYKYSFVLNFVKKKIFPEAMGFVVLGVFFINWFSLFASPTIGKWANLFIWTMAWPILIFTTAFFGRVTCALCPMAYIGEKLHKLFNLDKPLPWVLKKYGYLITTLSFVFVFWIEEFMGMRNSPVTTGLLVLTIVTIAGFTFLLFPRHTWCSNLCPLGTFISIVAMGSVFELRTDHKTCRSKCTHHFCYRGSKNADGCTLSQHAPYVDNSLVCKFCMKCTRSCPFHSVQLNLRKPGAEIPELAYINRGMVVFVITVLAMIFPVEFFESIKAQMPFEIWRIKFSFVYWTSVGLAMLGSWLFIRRKLDDPKYLLVTRMIFALSPTVTGLFIAHHLKYFPIAPNNWVLLLFVAIGMLFSFTLEWRILNEHFHNIPE